MTVRREIAKPRRETGARSLEDQRRTRVVRRGSEGRARRPSACRNSGSAVAAEVFMKNAGEESSGFSEMWTGSVAQAVKIQKRRPIRIRIVIGGTEDSLIIALQETISHAIDYGMASDTFFAETYLPNRFKFSTGEIFLAQSN